MKLLHSDWEDNIWVEHWLRMQHTFVAKKKLVRDLAIILVNKMTTKASVLDCTVSFYVNDAVLLSSTLEHN